MALVFSLLFSSLFALVSRVNATDETFVDKFLGSPLLILAAVVVIVAVAFVYHKIRK
jgi:cadmium resistance protein CadD (predicted permease)